MRRLFLSGVFLALAAFACAQSSSYVWTVYTGQPPQSGTADGTGPDARFNRPAGITADPAGNLYVCDLYNHTIRKVTPDGVVTTLAGTPGLSGWAEGPGTGARFDFPYGIAFANGALFVADSGNRIIRRIGLDGVVSTFVGTAFAVGSADGTGPAARFNHPCGLAAEAQGNLYVADTDNHTIRKITPAGVVTTLAGVAGSPGTTDGPATTARFRYPYGLACDIDGTLYIADTYNHTIRVLSPGGTVSTLAGSPGFPGASNAQGSAARFSYPMSLMLAPDHTVLVADNNNYCVRAVTPAGVVSTWAGRLNVEGSRDGDVLATARFFGPMGVVATADGGVAVTDEFNHSVRKINAAHDTMTSLAGTLGNFMGVDGVGNAARFNFPNGVALHPSGDVYVADSRGNTIRRVTPDRAAIRYVGNNAGAYLDGPVATASVNYPFGLVVQPDRTIYFCEQQYHTVRKVDASGIVSTLAGTPQLAGSTDGAGGDARFNFPSGIALAPDGTLYVADSSNHTIRRIAAGTNAVTTFAGLAHTPGSADGSGSGARFRSPQGLTTDAAGNLYVADSGNNTIRKITPAGVVTTVAGVPGPEGDGDGAASSAQFAAPWAVAVDAKGRIFVADYDNHEIRLIANGVVSTIGGVTFDVGFVNHGVANASRFFRPSGIAVDASGAVYATDTGLNIVIRGEPAVAPVIVTPPQPATVAAGDTTQLSVTATGADLTYQWNANGIDLPGATNATLTLAGVQPYQAGQYTVTVADDYNLSITSPVSVTVALPPGVGRLTNLSILANAGTGAATLAMGATLGGGSGTKPLLIRGMGPSLTGLGVGGALANPAMTVYQNGNPTATNDDWGGDTTLATVASRVGAFAFASPTSADAAFYNPALAAGSYTVSITGVQATTGLALAEIYDAGSSDPAAPRLTNLSARTYVDSGSNTLVAGFTVSGPGAIKVLIRGTGPALAQFGVNPTLEDPVLEVLQNGISIALVNNWSGTDLASAAASVGAFALPARSKDAALLLTLLPGSYTAQVRPASNTAAGVALVEIYEVP